MTRRRRRPRLHLRGHLGCLGCSLARTWPGSRGRERQIKRQGGAARRCPLSGVTPRGGTR